MRLLCIFSNKHHKRNENRYQTWECVHINDGITTRLIVNDDIDAKQSEAQFVGHHFDNAVESGLFGVTCLTGLILSVQFG